MYDRDDLIPRPPIVRERLAKTRREAARLRRLLRLAEAAARDRHEQIDPPGSQASDGKGGVS